MISAVLSSWVDVGILAALLLVNAVVGFHEKARAGHAIHALHQNLQTHWRVMRDQSLAEVLVRELVPGAHPAARRERRLKQRKLMIRTTLWRLGHCARWPSCVGVLCGFPEWSPHSDASSAVRRDHSRISVAPKLEEAHARLGRSWQVRIDWMTGH